MRDIPWSARRNLSRFTSDKAGRIQVKTRVRIHPRRDAPDTYPDLVQAWALARASGVLPVFDGASDFTIYTDSFVNIEARFWHDMVHLEHDLNFTLDDELEVCEIQRHDLQRAGFGLTSWESKMLWADLSGQAVCANRLHRFPVDQKAFVTTAIHDGIDAAIEQESTLSA